MPPPPIDAYADVELMLADAILMLSFAAMPRCAPSYGFAAAAIFDVAALMPGHGAAPPTWLTPRLFA